MDKLITLTPAEKSKIENQKQLYVLLRLINLVEQYHNYDKITKDQYKAEMPKLLQRYQGFSRVFPNFNLSQFLKSHDIEEQEVLWAKAALEKGANMEENLKKETYQFMEVTAKFIQISDRLAINQSNPILNEIKTSIEQLLMILKRLHVKIGVEFSQKYQQLQKIYDSSMNNRPITDVLTSTEFSEVRAVIESMYRILQLSMKN